MGVLFEVWKEIGEGYKEKTYQKAVAEGLKEKNIAYKEQVPAKVYFKSKEVGVYYFDFLIEDTIILEIKAKNYFSKRDIDQTSRYIKLKNIKLGILAYFSKNGVKYKRIVNLSN